MSNVGSVVNQGHLDWAQRRVLIPESADLPEVGGEFLHALHPLVRVNGTSLSLVWVPV